MRLSIILQQQSYLMKNMPKTQKEYPLLKLPSFVTNIE